MSKEEFFEKLHSLPGWDDMTRKGGAGVHLKYKGVDFLIYRDDALHYLKYLPSNEQQVDIIQEFNSLMEECRDELKKELEEWNEVRLTQDDNEGDR